MPLRQALYWFIAIILGLGILPSFTALSWQLFKDFPNASRFFGPINLLKIYAPFFIILIVLEWKKIKIGTKWGVGIFLGAGSLFSLISLARCGFPATEVRDWAVMALGLICGLSFTLLQKKHIVLVLSFWGTLIYGTALLDLLTPKVIDWLYANIFDPNTPITDFEQTRRRVLSGVFSRQSMAKYLAWMPWLLLAFSFRWKVPGWLKLSLGLLAILSSGAILATSQRGPFIAAAFGWLVFATHQSLRLKEHTIALVGGIAMVLSLILTFSFVPNDLIQQRFAFIGKIGKQEIIDPNIEFRKRITRVSLKQIAQNPFGNACIPKEAFYKEIVPPAHSHNLYLQQYLSRGWIWGTLHLFFWLLAWFGAWRSRSSEASALCAGLSVIIIGGLVDHPWFPLNHSMVLSVFLLLGLGFWKVSVKGKKWTISQN